MHINKALQAATQWIEMQLLNSSWNGQETEINEVTIGEPVSNKQDI